VDQLYQFIVQTTSIGGHQPQMLKDGKRGHGQSHVTP